jgi:Zn-dependent M16 (insulinase) family peptidase
METFTVGSQLGGYRVTQVGELPHLQAQYLRLKHLATGAHHIHIATADDNHTFGVAFPTVPRDSTGIAHILEHIVLAGSERFPVRDPFFSMIPRSLSTFMNAMTYPDRTVYPFSTRNTRDFFNLLEVYLDACFFPTIDYFAFRQEGWRYEFAEPTNPASQLTYGGVVFNEMKGAMSSPASVLYRAMGRAIFPDLTYANNSGGDPAFIPDLTWEALKAFHATHYHPSNAFFYTYGSLPPGQILGAIETQVMARFAPIDPHTAIPDQPRFGAPRQAREVYAIAPGENPHKKAQVLLAWLTTRVDRDLEILGLEVLERVLLANAASPLRKALLESGLGSALADGSGLQAGYREPVFAVGLKGVNPEDAPAIEAIVQTVLHQQAEQGVDPQQVEAALHRIELEQREVSNAGYPYSLKLLSQMAVPYIAGVDPYRSLQLDQTLAEFHQAQAQGGFLEGLLRRYLLDNTHRVTLTLAPDDQLGARLEAEEKARLAQVQSQLSSEQVQQIVAESQTLKERQDAPEDTSVLPGLELSDIPLVADTTRYQLVEHRGATVGLCAQPTNGLAYLELQFGVQGLSEAEQDLLPLLAYAWPRMGGGASDYLQMAARIEAHTGGIGAGTGLRTAPDNLQQARQHFTLTARVLQRNLPALWAIFSDLLLSLRWDVAHLRNLLGQLRAQFESRVTQAGHMLAWSLASSQLGGWPALQERLEGLTQLATLKRLTQLDQAGIDGLMKNLENLRQKLLATQGLQVCLTAEEGALGSMRSDLEGLLDRLPSTPILAGAASLPVAAYQPQARHTAVPVAYDARVVQTVPATHPDAPALMVLATLLRPGYLHREIREKGGAYGAFSTYRLEQGVFAFLTYRDPHIARSFQVFDGALDYLAQLEDPQRLKEAILSAAGALDPLLSPDTRGRTRFFDDRAGYSAGWRLEFKRQLLSLTLPRLREVAQTYLTRPAALAVISNEDKIRQASAEMGLEFHLEAI